MPLSYLCNDCHKQEVTHIRESRWFESMYTLQGKTRPTHHTLLTLSPRMLQDHTYLTWSTYSNLSYIRQQFWTDPVHLRRRAPDTIHNTLTDRSVGPYSASLPQQTMEQWGKSSFCWQPTTRLTGPISPTCDRYVQYLLTGPTHRFLTDIGGGYNLGGASLPHTTPRPSQPVVSTFHLRAPPSLQFNQVPSIKSKCWV
jgi:hypothetical protein